MGNKSCEIICTSYQEVPQRKHIEGTKRELFGERHSPMKKKKISTVTWVEDEYRALNVERLRFHPQCLSHVTFLKISLDERADGVFF